MSKIDPSKKAKVIRRRAEDVLSDRDSSGRFKKKSNGSSSKKEAKKQADTVSKDSNVLHVGADDVPALFSLFKENPNARFSLTGASLEMIIASVVKDSISSCIDMHKQISSSFDSPAVSESLKCNLSEKALAGDKLADKKPSGSFLEGEKVASKAVSAFNLPIVCGQVGSSLLMSVETVENCLRDLRDNSDLLLSVLLNRGLISDPSFFKQGLDDYFPLADSLPTPGLPARIIRSADFINALKTYIYDMSQSIV